MMKFKNITLGVSLLAIGIIVGGCSIDSPKNNAKADKSINFKVLKSETSNGDMADVETEIIVDKATRVEYIRVVTKGYGSGGVSITPRLNKAGKSIVDQ